MLRKVTKIFPGSCLKFLFKHHKQHEVVQHDVRPEKSFRDILNEEMEKASGKDNND